MACSDGPSSEMKELSQETFDVGTISFGSFRNPHIGSTLHNQNHLPSIPIMTSAGEMRQANRVKLKSSTHSQSNGKTQQGIKTGSGIHKEEKLVFLKNDKVNYTRNRYTQLRIYLLVPSDKLLLSDKRVHL